MPFDFEKVTGTWKHVRYSDNYREMMEKLGVPVDHVEKVAASDITFEVHLQASGNAFTIKCSFMGKEWTNTHTLGEEGEEVDPEGTKRKLTMFVEGDDLVSMYPSHDGKGLVVREIRRFIGDNIRVEFKIGEVEGWWEMERC